MLYIDKIVVSDVQPSTTNIGWIKPFKDGFSLYTSLDGKWLPVKLVDTKNPDDPDDDSEEFVIAAFKVNGDTLPVESDGTVNVTITEGDTNGTLKVNGIDISVKGLGTAAYSDTDAFESAGAITTAIEALGKEDTAELGKYVSAVSEEGGIITVSRASLPDYSETYDAYGAASTAETNARDYADGLATNYDAAGSASSAEIAAKNYADGLAVNYDPAGAAANVLGTSADASTANTVYGAKAYTDAMSALKASLTLVSEEDTYSRTLSVILALAAFDGTTTSITNPEWKFVLTDDDDKVLLGIKQDMTWYYGADLDEILDCIISGYGVSI